jgi:hypothetical protein
MITRTAAIFLLALAPFFVKAQWAFRGLETSNTITLAIKDTVYSFHVRLQEKEVKPSLIRNYHWFHEGELRRTQGNYTGKLLHGALQKFDRNGMLLEKGDFKDGLKTGLWLTWHSNGNLSGRYSWKNGSRSGKFEEYYATGVVSRSGTFLQNKLSGYVSAFAKDGTLLSKTKFKDGNVVVPKEKKIKERKEIISDSTAAKKKRFGFGKKKEKKNEEIENIQPEPPVAPADQPVKERKRKKKDKKNTEEDQQNNTGT